MKTTKFLLASAVTVLLPFASLAAIDDQGMQYVSAAEGLHGSLRVNILKNEDKATSDVTTGGAVESLRLWITGSGDIGNGWATTYYWEVRDGNRDADGNGEKDAGVIGTEAWTVGLKSPWGAFDFGRSAMVAPRMVPGGSLDTIVGGNAAHFACDVCDNTHRFESASFNGFQFGVSAVTNGDELLGKVINGVTLTVSEDDVIDEYSIAIKYASPLGFQIGAGYEVRLLHDERYGTVTSAADYEDKSGWRLGARYGQGNWLLGYEYRAYDGHPGWENNLYFGPVASSTGGWYNETGISLIAAATGVTPANTAAVANNNRPSGSRLVAAGVGADFNSKLDYTVHRMGAQLKFDRITASAGYSLETQSIAVAGAVDIDRTAFAVDAAYHLGLNSLLAVGWKKVNTETWARGVPNPAGGSAVETAFENASAVGRTLKAKDTTTQLYYRVDF